MSIRYFPQRFFHGGGGGSGHGKKVAPSSKSAPSTPQQSSTGTVELTRSKAFLTKFFGEKFVEGAMERLKSAPESIQKLWEAFADRFTYMTAKEYNKKYGDTYGRVSMDAAFHHPAMDVVVLNEATVMQGKSYSDPFNTLFHEIGHNIDFYMGTNSLYGHFTDDNRIQDALHRDVEKLLSEQRKILTAELSGSKTKTRITDHMVAEKLVETIDPKHTYKDKADLSDMLEGAFMTRSRYGKTNIRINGNDGRPFGVGHGNAYWSSRGANKEVFAEITAALVSSPGSLSVIQTYLPETYKAYESVLSDMVSKMPTTGTTT